MAFFDSPSAHNRRIVLWTSLEPGDNVLLRMHGFVHHRGTVDDRTEDGSTIWVVDRIGDRRLFHIEDEYELDLAPASGPFRR